MFMYLGAQLATYQVNSTSYEYSGTSDKGPSEIGTTSQKRTQFWTPFP